MLGSEQLQNIYNNLDTNESAIWSLLFATGYLKVLSYQTEEECFGNEYALYHLVLTNEEVRKIFFRMVKEKINAG